MSDIAIYTREARSQSCFTQAHSYTHSWHEHMYRLNDDIAKGTLDVTIQCESVRRWSQTSDFILVQIWILLLLQVCATFGVYINLLFVRTGNWMQLFAPIESNQVADFFPCEGSFSVVEFLWNEWSRNHNYNASVELQTHFTNDLTS